MNLLLKKIIRISHLAEDGLLVIILTGLILLAVAQILLRNIFDSSLLWADPVIRISVLWIGLLGATIGTRQGEHIAIDILSHYVSGTLKIWVQRVVSLTVMVVSALMAWLSWQLVMLEKNEWLTLAFADVPVWPFQIIMPLAFAYIAMRSFVHVLTGEATQ